MAVGHKIVDGPLVGDIFSSNLILLLRVGNVDEMERKKKI